jgi:hypothetical protein
MATRGTKITGLNDVEVVSGNLIIPVVDPTVTLATPDGQTLQANLFQLGNFILDEAGNSLHTANVANTIRNNAQPNITSVGTLTSLTVSGNVSIGSNLSVTGNLSVNNITANDITVDDITADLINANVITANIVTASLANGTSNVRIPVANGNVNISVAGNANVATFSGTGMTINGISNLGNISNVKIYGGSNHFVIVTDGTGNLSWEKAAVADGPNTAIQFNDNGTFGGSSAFTFNKDTNVVGITKFAKVGGNASFIPPSSAGTSQQVLGIINQNTQEMGWKTVPVYYITVDMRDGSNYLSSPDPVLRVCNIEV